MIEDLSNSSILIVDDMKSNIDMLVYALKNNYKLDVAENGIKALESVEEKLPDLILLDIMMPKMNGYDVCSRLKSNEKTKEIPIIFISAMDETINKTKGFELGAVDYIIKPFDIIELKARINNHLALKKTRETLENQNIILEEKVRKRTEELYETRLEIVYRLGRAAEYRDNETGMHIKRMSNYCAVLGRAAGLNEDECELLLHSSPMHDVGKIGIPDSILLKHKKLNAEEWEIMKTHTTIGGKILSGHNSKQLQMALRIAMTHHEKWSGDGYPNKLMKEEIPIEGRIAGIADVFDALVSKRPYKKAWPVEEALTEIKLQKSKHFDPDLVDLFFDNIEEMIFIKNKFSEYEEY